MTLAQIARDEFIGTSPGTLGGRYLREYWQPVFESARLPAGGTALIRVMGERFTLYRGESGTVHIVSPSCPHRNTQLSSGWVEGDSIRCLYHGWLFDANGKCREQPAEPKPFCEKVAIQSYPAREYLGLIFGYFGGATDPPPLPKWPEVESEAYISSSAMIPCNYFQSAENIVDYAHAAFVHKPVSKLGRGPREMKVPLAALTRVEEVAYGVRISQTSLAGLEDIHYMMPNVAYVSYSLGNVAAGERPELYRMQSLFWYVPIDDESHLHVMTTAGIPEVIEIMKEEQQTPHSVADDILRVLNDNLDLHKDKERILRRPDMVRLQDGVTIVGQGAIADRTRERLGASDAGIVLLRKLWRRQLAKCADGAAASPFLRPQELRASLSAAAV